MVLRPSLTDFKKWLTKVAPAGHPSFTPKSYRVTLSSPGCNYGSTKPNNAHQLNTAKEADSRHVFPLFERYLVAHPYTPHADLARNMVLLDMYYRKAWNWVQREEKHQPEMLGKGFRGMKADEKMRNGAHLSSSWIKGARQPSQNTIEFKLGKKFYSYNIVDFNKIMTCHSIGSTIAQLRKLPSGSIVNGLQKR